MLSRFALVDVLKGLTEQHKATNALQSCGWLVANLKLIAQKRRRGFCFLAEVIINVRRDDHLSLKGHCPWSALAEIPKQVAWIGRTIAAASAHHLDSLHQRQVRKRTEKLNRIKNI